MTLLFGTMVGAQPSAHVHGHAELSVAIDAKTITVMLVSPLDSLLGFERRPRTQAEHNRVRAMARDLQAADRQFTPDPAARCRLGSVVVDSPVLKNVPSANRPPPDAQAPQAGRDTAHEHKHKAGHRHQHGDGHNHDHDHEEDEAHMELTMTAVFDCEDGNAARFVDTRLFETFKRLERIDANVAAARGQFKRSLRPAQARLSWER